MRKRRGKMRSDGGSAPIIRRAAAWSAGLASWTLLVTAASTAAADTFVLNNGGRIEGELLNPSESPREQYEVRTPLGRVLLAARDVKYVRSESEDEAWYRTMLPMMPATLEGNWKMAELCRERKLNDERRVHLENVLEFDSGHEGARRALGFTQVDGEWIQTEVWMRQQGLQRHNGTWMAPQEIQIVDLARQRELQEKEWRRQLKIWRAWLGRGKRHTEAIRKFASLDDPMAAAGLADLLAEEQNKEVKLLLIDSLAKFRSPYGVTVFLKMAMNDKDMDVVDKCLDHLVEYGGGQAAQFLMGSGGLGHKDNAVVNRAALALARLKAPDTIPALIDALVTNHKFISVPKGGAGSINPVFGSGGAGGLSMGGKPKIIRQDLANQGVHDALIALTGGVVDFKYEEAAWKRWWAAKQTPKAVNLRRRF